MARMYTHTHKDKRREGETRDNIQERVIRMMKRILRMNHRKEGINTTHMFTHSVRTQQLVQSL